MMNDNWSGASTNPERLRSNRVGPRGATMEKDPGIFPDSEGLSLTACPVHLLSVTRTEWVEMAWAARNAVQDDVNLERRGWFESVKCLLRDRDLPPSEKFNERVWGA